MANAANSMESRDVAFHLHPFTNARKHLEVGPLIIESGQGIYVKDVDGKQYIEALSGLWCAGLGFSEKRLAKAAMQQMEKLPFYHTFSHKSHNAIIELAEKLVSLAPGRMSKAFFASSGSEAIDTALKLIWYRSNALGQPQKKKIIVRDRGYHGSTAAAACLTSMPNLHRSFDMIVPNVLRLTCPHHYREARPDENEEEFASRLAQELEDRILAEGPDTVAAFFGEPLIGAGGVVVPPATYWAKVQAILKKYDILLVADEVICGFGRTGKMFGCETFGIEPDIMVLSKQLTASYLPASALLVNDKVFDPIMEESGRIGTLGHGFTSSGHPTVAAVALETIRIIEEDGLVDRAAAMGERLRAGLDRLSSHPLVGEVRGAGLIAAIELVTQKETKAPFETLGQLGTMTAAHLQDLGVITRPIGDAIAFCPPMIIEEKEIDDLLSRLEEALGRTLNSLPAGVVAT